MPYHVSSNTQPRAIRLLSYRSLCGPSHTSASRRTCRSLSLRFSPVRPVSPAPRSYRSSRCASKQLHPRCSGQHLHNTMGSVQPLHLPPCHECRYGAPPNCWPFTSTAWRFMLAHAHWRSGATALPKSVDPMWPCRKASSTLRTPAPTPSNVRRFATARLRCRNSAPTLLRQCLHRRGRQQSWQAHVPVFAYHPRCLWPQAAASARLGGG